MSEQEFQMPKPGEPHAKLNPFEGTFTADVKIFMGPGETQNSTGKITNSWHVDGLYLHQDYQGDAVDGPYPSFAGRGYWGYNPSKNTYEGFWIDNASSMMQMESGNVDESGMIWEMHSSDTHPTTGKEFTKRTVITLVNNDSHTHESFMNMGEGEFKTMEITYSRC